MKVKFVTGYVWVRGEKLRGYRGAGKMRWGAEILAREKHQNVI